MTNLSIALDAMSGDLGPRPVVEAALSALELYPNLTLYLVGDNDSIKPNIPNNFKHQHRLNIIETNSVITHEMGLSYAIKHSKGSSMRTALELVKDNQAMACISSGNTAALMGLSKLLIETIDSVERPALVATIPAVNQKNTIILDLGANAECTSIMLQQFAYMGSLLAKTLLNITEPKVSLLNIGKEDVKGLDRIKSAAVALKNDHNINYIGYLEGDDLLTGKTDVLVCDGFTGNVTLKTIEGLARILLESTDLLSKKRSFLMSLFTSSLRKKMNAVFGDLDPNRYNGACLIGLKSIVVKSHGSANSKSFLSAIKLAVVAIEHDLSNTIKTHLPLTLPKSE